MKCFVWSVVLYGAETWTLRRNEQKQLEAFEMWVWRRMERLKWTDKIKNAIVLERVGEGRITLELMRKSKRNWLGHWLRRNCLQKDALEHGCANHGTEGKRFSPPSTAVTQRFLPTYSVANTKRLFVYTVCCRRGCSASLLSDHVN